MITPVFPPDVLEKYAELMLWGLTRGRSAPFSKSDFILVNYDIDGLPLAEEICSQIHDAGYIPIPRAMLTPRMEHDRFTKANNKRLTTLIPGEKDLYNHLNGAIHVIAPASLSHLNSIEPERISLSQKARQPLRVITQTRENMGAYGWTLCMYPTQAMAAQASMSLEEYADEVKRACWLTDGTPVRKWKLLVKQAEEIRQWLTSLGNITLRVESDSVDLLLKVGERRTWRSITGRNIPSFEVYVSPDYRSVEGVYHTTLPSYHQGRIVSDLRLEISGGKVQSLTAAQGEEFITEQLNLDQGASRIGEFALVDKRFSPIRKFMANTLFDENHGGEHGSMHIALGNSYANTFNGNGHEFDQSTRESLGFNSSSLHWDLVNAENKRVTALMPEGKRLTLYEDGQFTV